MPWTMFSREGQRKYLTKSEFKIFLNEAQNRHESIFYFCWTLAATGCRISEALALTPKNIDFEAQNLIVESLKKRGRRMFRAIPLPTTLLVRLKTWIAANRRSDALLWPWSRMTGYRRICEVMAAAGIEGAYASPKGLRHAFGVGAVQSGVPLNLVQRWLGHADMKTTAIYASASGPEEREIAARMWGGNSPSLMLGDALADAETAIVPGVEASAGDHVDPDPAMSPFLPPATPRKRRPSLGQFLQAVRKWRVTCLLIHFWLFCNYRKTFHFSSFPPT